MLKNPKWEKFCQAYVETDKPGEAYKRAGYTGAGAEQSAAALLKNPNISARILSIRKENAALAKIGKERAIEILCDIVMTPIAKINEHHYLAQELTVDKNGRRIKMPGKMDALKTLGQWCGFETGTEAENKAADALGVMARVRKGREK